MVGQMSYSERLLENAHNLSCIGTKTSTCKRHLTRIGTNPQFKKVYIRPQENAADILDNAQTLRALP